MKNRTIPTVLLLLLAVSLSAAPPSLSITNDGSRSTLTYSYDAADVFAEPPPVLPVAEWQGSALENLLVLGVPAEVEVPYSGSVSVLDPTSGAFAVIGTGMAREALKAGEPPPYLAEGIRRNILANLKSRYGRYFSEAVKIFQDQASPSDAIARLASDTPAP